MVSVGGRTFTHLATLVGHRATIGALALSESWGVFATGDLDGTVVVWDLGSLDIRRRLSVAPSANAASASANAAADDAFDADDIDIVDPADGVLVGACSTKPISETLSPEIFITSPDV